MQPDVREFFDEVSNTFTYLVTDPASDKAAIIDPVLDFDHASGRTDTISIDRVLECVAKEALSVQWILETHAHADHLSAAPYVKQKLGGKIAIGEHIQDVQQIFKPIFHLDTMSTDGSQFDHLFRDGDTFQIGNLQVSVIHTPGHTPACVTYVIGDAAFVGDTLFMPDYGSARCDFPGGDARILYQSVQKLFALPADTRLFMCHDYLPQGRSRYLNQTTVAEEKANNIHLHEGISEDEFVAMRTKRDSTLNMPKLILPSVQVNIKAGELPDPADNGIRYLVLPLDAV